MVPTTTELKTLDYSYQGQPFCFISSDTTANLDYRYQGQPFYGLYITNTGGFFIFF